MMRLAFYMADGVLCLTCLPGKLSAQKRYSANWDGGMSVK